MIFAFLCLFFRDSPHLSQLQTALHAKAKAEAGYRFYALYDKISREDILAHAYAQCPSNKGAPGGDGQDFADIGAYGVQRSVSPMKNGSAYTARVKISQQNKPIPNMLRMSPMASMVEASVTKDVTVAPSTTTTAQYRV
jgi:hypothetical protein